MNLLNIVTAVAREMLGAFFLNYLVIIVYVIVIYFIKTQYERYQDLQGGQENAPRPLKEIVEEVVLTGLIAGFAGSIVAVFLGITIEPEAVRGLLFITCILLFFNLRYVCISYSAGILALISLLFGYPRLHIPSVLGLVAVMHLVESVLVFMNRGRGSIPVFIKHGDDISGAYLIRKFWPVPVVFLSFLAQNAAQGTASIAVNWHTLFNPEILGGGVLVFGLDCIIALLCYSDLAVTKHPEKKSREMAGATLIYSLVLMTLALISGRYPWVGFIGAAFCAGAHEGIALYSKHMEKTGKPIYKTVRRGLRVFDIVPGSHAELMGIQKGDIILSINGKDIQSEEGINEALREYPTFTWIEVAGWDEKPRTYEYKCYPGGYNVLGVVPVPREKDVTYNIDHFESMSILRNIVSRFKGINRSV